jgi:tetratricopeptide (TPR) repeat protein
MGLRMGAVLAWFWRLRGHLREGRYWARAILAACPERTILRSTVLSRTVMLIYAQEEAMALAEEGLMIAREHDDLSAVGWALHAMGRVLHARVRYQEATVVLEQSLAMFRRMDDPVGCSYSSWFLGNALREQGDYPRAGSLYADALTFARRAGDSWAIASSLLQLGVLAHKNRHLEEASALLKESLATYRDIRAPWGVWFCLTDLVVVAARRGDSQRAACLAGAEGALRARLDPVMGIHHRADYESGLRIARQALSASAYARGRARGESMTLEQALDYALSPEDEG